MPKSSYPEMRGKNFRFPVTTLAGSTPGNIRQMVLDHVVEPAYRNKYLLTKAVAGIFEVFSFAERLIWQKRIREYRHPVPPVFIIGFWRSGTTLLHNLLCQDPGAAYTTTFHTVFPNLVLTQSWWLKPIINLLLPENRPYDNVSMDMDFPQEEDFGLMNMQPSSIYKFFIFPADFDRIIANELFTARLPADRVAQWKAAYREMMAKAALNTGGKRYTGKNPCHMARIELLLEMFPDAKFIFIHRHPYKVCESLYHFILSIFPGVQLQAVPAGFSRETVVRLYQAAMDHYFAHRALIPPENLVEIKLDDLLKDVPANLEKIYLKLGLGDFGVVRPRVERYLAENPSPAHNAWPPSGETVSLVNRYAAGHMELLGYDKREG